MNRKYEILFLELGMPATLIDYAMGRISSPVVSLVSPAEWYCFPPALCPVWCDPSLPFYLGLWKHWFVDRPPTFVAFYVEAAKVYEIARTTDQLFCHMIISSIAICDSITPAIEHFSTSVGVRNLAEIDSVSLATKDDPRGYGVLDQFREDVPLESVADQSQYSGAFPLGTFAGPRQWWEEACVYEVPDEVLDSWPINIPKPRWFQSGDRESDFEKFIREKDYRAAWLTLNSPGWSIAAARTALARLKKEVDEQVFSLMADAWTSVAR